MFTGLVEAVGAVDAVAPLPSGQGLRVTLRAPLLDEVQAIGASLAVDGVCLTVTEAARGWVRVEVGAETLARTTFASLRPGARVNLERPMRLGDRLGGHMVSGHVDGLGRVARLAHRGEALDITVAAAPALLRYVVEKGSIAIDGISLTVNRVDAAGFDVSIIPHTQSATTLADKPVGAPLHLEVDLIGKYVEKLLAGHLPATSTLAQKLEEHGFVR
jgi:riboflavin synthase